MSYIDWFVVAVVAVLGTGRIARLVTHDVFPPSAWLRAWWEGFTERHRWLTPWQPLLFCFWCLTPWLMVVTLLWGVWSGFHWSWWAFYGWLALSYVTSMVVARDERAE